MDFKDNTNDEYPIPFTMTTAGYVLPTVTGLLSTCCSILILNIIRLSPEKLFSTYHRFMATMSIFDIMGSMCIALSTLPMPSDDPLIFAGPMKGNKQTCQAQGYFAVLGLVGGSTMYMCLSWYFVCKITFQVHSYTIRKWIEPLMFVYSFSLAFFLATFNLSNDLFHSVPSKQHCAIAPAHTNCTYTSNGVFEECKYESVNGTYEKLKMFIIGCNTGMVVLSMMIIIYTMFRKNKTIENILKRKSNSDVENDSNADVENHSNADVENHSNADVENHSDADNFDNGINISGLQYSRVLVVQALMYIFAFMITWVFTFITEVVETNQRTPNLILILRATFFPMQGFWNLIIFVYDKAYLVYQKNPDNGYWNAVKTVLLHPEETSPGLILLPADLKNDSGESKDCLSDQLDPFRINDGLSSISFPVHKDVFPIDAEDHKHSCENNMSHKSSFSSLKEQDDGNRLDEEDNLNYMMRTMCYYDTHASGKQDAASILKLISRAIDPESNYGISGEGGGTYPSLNICPSLVTAMNEASTAQISGEQEKRKGRVIYMNPNANEVRRK